MSARSKDAQERPKPPHPAANAHLIGHLRAEARMLEAARSGRMHHAWLLSGPRGIGKATLAYRFARFLLAHGAAIPQQAESLHVDESHPVFHMLAAGAHPDLAILERGIDPRTKKPRANILVDDARKISHFLSMTAAEGGWRIVIADAADDMNPQAANAILKILEEPPANCLFLMVSHAPGRLLPTIRSRCLHLPIRPLSEEQVREALAVVMPRLAAKAIANAAPLSRGAPGRAVQLAGSRAAGLFTRYRDMAESPGSHDPSVSLAMAADLAKAANAEDFRLFTSLLREWMQDRARQAAIHGQASLARRWARLSSEAAHMLTRLEALNLDRRQALSHLLGAAERLSP